MSLNLWFNSKCFWTLYLWNQRICIKHTHTIFLTLADEKFLIAFKDNCPVSSFSYSPLLIINIQVITIAKPYYVLGFCFRNINSFNHQNKILRQVLLSSSFYRGGKQAQRGWVNLPKITQLVGGCAGFKPWTLCSDLPSHGRIAINKGKLKVQDMIKCYYC